MRIIVMGTGPFAVPSFNAIRQSEHEIVLVVTKPEPPVKSRKGAPPAPVRSWAELHALDVYDPPSINDAEAIDRLTRLEADLLVVCDYGQILRPEALASTPLGGINLHGSLLPAYRGAAPVQRSLLNGDASTGVSVIHMTPKLDGGPILCKLETPIDPQETAGELEERLSRLGVEPTLESIQILAQWDQDSAIGEIQDTTLATKAPRLNKQEARIDWSQNRRTIDCHVRGMQPWPVAFSEVVVRSGKPPLRLAVLSVTEVEADSGGLAPGELVGGKELIVMTGDGPIRIDAVKPAGKREMSGEQFLRGHQLERGTKLL